MSKFKLTKGELKRQRDALGQYERYLPTLQLKKQQLQLEINRQLVILEKKRRDVEAKKNEIAGWAGLLSEQPVNLKTMIQPEQIITAEKNIAGVDLPLFERLEFEPAEYDLFLCPLWVDTAIEELRKLVSLRQELKVLEKEVAILRQELRITTQRVNLFEKIKIPAAREAIRAIKIYLGDQMTNAVGRSKIAKRKFEELASQVA
ncbi:MAG: V-type ATP synthase subunit D [Candidatus Omnitrophota bacterium]|nr:MAG: V-type ATP synthase subunit D [Candidatus Omnitrophota bacterium]